MSSTGAERSNVCDGAYRFRPVRQVGAILNGAKVGSRYLADAHVVAVCVQYGGGLVITSDPDDIMHLAAAVPAARIITRSPE